MKKLETAAIKARAEKATPGPWRSMRDGNQYINTGYIPTKKCVGASKIEEIPRPWNPHAYLAFGMSAEMFEISRFLDADADFIAQAREDIPALLSALEAAEGTLVEIEEYWNGNENHGAMSDALDHILDLVHKALRGEGN